MLTPCKPYEIAEFRMEAAIAVKSFSRRRLLLAMAMLNSYAWRIAEDWNLIEKHGDRWTVISSEKVRQAAITCGEGKGAVHNALTSLQEYVTRHWKFACNNIKTLRSMRLFFKNLGLFDFEEIETKEIVKRGKLHRIPAKATVQTPEIKELDLLKILLAYQVCDRLLKSKIEETDATLRDYTDEELAQVGGDVTYRGWDKGLQKSDCLPKHGGALMIDLFNNCFSRQYHEYNDDIAFVPPSENEVEVPAVKAIAYKWKKSFSLNLRKWAEIHYQEFGSFGSLFLDAIFTPEQDESLCDVPY